MTDFTNLVDKVNIPELVKALRCENEEYEYYTKCKYHGDTSDNRCVLCDTGRLAHDAAAAIEELQARLGEAENSVERWKDMYLTKHEPKRGEWIPYEFNTNGTWHKCSVCGVAYQYKDAPNSGWWINHKYCPNCGAKMEEVQE